MRTGLTRTVAAELIKLRTLPAVLATTGGTVLAAVALAWASARTGPADVHAVGAVARALPLLQVGPIVLGVLAAASEYAGRQIVPTMTATPRRLQLLAAKSLGYLVVAVLTHGVAVAAAFGTAAATLAARAGDAPEPGPTGWLLVGAVGHLTLIGLPALALAVVLRSLVAPLATMSTGVLIVSPLLAGWTEHARWLPDRAGMLLYQPAHDGGPGPATGLLVLLVWVAVGLLAAGTAWTSRDA